MCVVNRNVIFYNNFICCKSWEHSTQCGLIIKVYRMYRKAISTYVFPQKMYSWHMVAFTLDSFQLTCLQCQCTVHVSENRKWLMASYKQFANFWCDTLFYNHSGRTCLGEMALEKCHWRNVFGEMSLEKCHVMMELLCLSL